MRKYGFITLLFLISFFIAKAQTPQTTYVVPDVSTMQSYFGMANRIFVMSDTSDYVQCVSCTIDGTTVLSGAGGRKWMKLVRGSSNEGTLSRFGIEDNTGVQDREMTLGNSSLNIDGNSSGIGVQPAISYMYTNDSTNTNNRAQVDVDASPGIARFYVQTQIVNGSDIHQSQFFISGDSTYLMQGLSNSSGFYEDTIIIPKTISGKYYIPLSVNGNYANVAGNINISDTIDITYDSILSKRLNKQLISNKVYHITDKDLGWYFTTSSNGTLSNTGLKVMYAPTTYKTEVLDGNNWRGMYDSTITNPIAIGDLMIWNTEVWKNLTGNIGSIINQQPDTTNWSFISSSSFTNNEYSPIVIHIQMDWDYDFGDGGSKGLVIKGWDSRNNLIIGFRDYRTTTEPIDFTDWKQLQQMGAYGNKAFQIIDNVLNMTQTYNYYFHDNNTMSEISNNQVKNYFYNNIMNGSCQSNISNDIYDNNCIDMYGNGTPSIRTDMYHNYVNGYMDGNVCSGGIYNNVTTQDLQYNAETAGNTMEIGLNIVNGWIQFNVGAGNGVIKIIQNKNNGNIGNSSTTTRTAPLTISDPIVNK